MQRFLKSFLSSNICVDHGCISWFLTYRATSQACFRKTQLIIPFSSRVLYRGIFPLMWRKSMMGQVSLSRKIPPIDTNTKKEYKVTKTNKRKNTKAQKSKWAICVIFCFVLKACSGQEKTIDGQGQACLIRSRNHQWYDDEDLCCTRVYCLETLLPMREGEGDLKFQCHLVRLNHDAFSVHTFLRSLSFLFEITPPHCLFICIGFLPPSSPSPPCER